MLFRSVKLIDPDIGTNSIYTVVFNDVNFALTTKTIDKISGNEIILTVNLKLIINVPQGGTPFKKQGKTIENIDMIAYILPKFIYVEKHIRTQMKHLYID